jgi:DNA-binding HxlR family transcriptional regulator
VAEHRPIDEAAGVGALTLLGERWNYLLIREIYFGVHRFGQLQRALGIAPNVLTARLRSLTAAGILSKVRYHEDPDWFEYHLSETSRQIVPAMLYVAQWAEENLSDTPDVRLLRHTVCGKRTHPKLVCNECGEELLARDLAPEVVKRPKRRRRAA